MGMVFNTPLPRTGQPRFHEASRLRSIRDADTVLRGWMRSEQATQQAYGDSRALANIQRQLNRLRLRAAATQEGVGHPFKIRRSGTSWLHIKVKTGWIITTGAPFEPTNADTDLLLTTNEAFNYIYMTLTTTTATFATSVSVPTWSVSVVPVGWVDTTNTADERVTIKQFLRDHVFIPCV
jgi:hypothetical protein